MLIHFCAFLFPVVGDKRDSKVRVEDPEELEKFATEDRPPVDTTPNGADPTIESIQSTDDEDGEDDDEDGEDGEEDEDDEDEWNWNVQANLTFQTIIINFHVYFHFKNLIKRRFSIICQHDPKEKINKIKSTVIELKEEN